MASSSDGFYNRCAKADEARQVSGMLQDKIVGGNQTRKLGLLLLLLLLMEPLGRARSSVLLSSGKLEACKRDAIQTEDLICELKVVLGLTVVNGEVYSSSKV